MLKNSQNPDISINQAKRCQSPSVYRFEVQLLGIFCLSPIKRLYLIWFYRPLIYAIALKSRFYIRFGMWVTTTGCRQKPSKNQDFAIQPYAILFTQYLCQSRFNYLLKRPKVSVCLSVKQNIQPQCMQIGQ